MALCDKSRGFGGWPPSPRNSTPNPVSKSVPLHSITTLFSTPVFTTYAEPIQLSEAKAIGVWGNHDYGLCVEPVATDCAKYGDIVIRFMTSELIPFNEQSM